MNQNFAAKPVASQPRVRSIVLGPFGNIDQQVLCRAIAAEITLHNRETGEVIRENSAMKQLVAQLG